MKAVRLFKLFVVIIFTAFYACTNGENTTSKTDNNTKYSDTTTLTNSQNNTNTQKQTTTTPDSLSKQPKEAKQSTPKDYTAKYICPMHCPKSGSDKMGDCPVCGMELIENPNYNNQKKIEN